MINEQTGHDSEKLMSELDMPILLKASEAAKHYLDGNHGVSPFDLAKYSWYYGYKHCEETLSHARQPLPEMGEAELNKIRDEFLIDNNSMQKIYMTKGFNVAIERVALPLQERVRELEFHLEQKSGEIGRAEHRGNTVDYIYDKCRVYGDQLCWRFDQLTRIEKILKEDWQGSPAQEEVTRRNKEYNALQSQLQATTRLLELAVGALENAETAIDHALELDYFNPGGSTEMLSKEALKNTRRALAEIRKEKP
jgi:hypothetical protein